MNARGFSAIYDASSTGSESGRAIAAGEEPWSWEEPKTPGGSRRRVRSVRESVVLGTRGARGLAVIALGVCLGCDAGARPIPVQTDYATADTLVLPISIEGHRIIDASGDTVVLNGDTPWSLVAQLDSAEVLHYLQTRARQGVNAILFNLIEHRYAERPPLNAYGLAPFTATLPDGQYDFTALNGPYWDFVEWVITEAQALGMLCFVVPAYVGYEFNSSGWSRELMANGPVRLTAYGDSLTRRLGAYENLIWVFGGDWSAVWEGQDIMDEVDAIAMAIDRALPTAIMTAHTRRNLSALDSYDRPWLDINTTYSEAINGPDRLELDHARTTTAGVRRMPSIWIEGYYENEHDMSPEMLRAQIYWSLLSGASGHFYGIHPVWSFGSGAADRFGDSDEPPYESWETALESEVGQDLIHVRRLTEELPIHHLRPDFGRDLLKSSRGEGREWIAVAVAEDGSAAALYTPRRQSLSVDLSALGEGDSVGVRWVDPGSWAQWDEGTHPPLGEVRFRPPAPGDWLLLLQRKIP